MRNKSHKRFIVFVIQLVQSIYLLVFNFIYCTVSGNFERKWRIIDISKCQGGGEAKHGGGMLKHEFM